MRTRGRRSRARRGGHRTTAVPSAQARAWPGPTEVPVPGTVLEVLGLRLLEDAAPPGCGPELRRVGQGVVNADGTITARLDAVPVSGRLWLRPLPLPGPPGLVAADLMGLLDAAEERLQEARRRVVDEAERAEVAEQLAAAEGDRAEAAARRVVALRRALSAVLLGLLSARGVGLSPEQEAQVRASLDCERLIGWAERAPRIVHAAELFPPLRA